MLSACIRITYSRKAKLEIRNRNHYSTSLIISFGARVQCIAVQYSEWVKRAHGARVYMQRAGYECGVRLMFIIVIKQHKWYYEILCRTTRVWGGGGVQELSWAHSTLCFILCGSVMYRSFRRLLLRCTRKAIYESSAHLIIYWLDNKQRARKGCIRQRSCEKETGVRDSGVEIMYCNH